MVKDFKAGKKTFRGLPRGSFPVFAHTGANWVGSAKIAYRTSSEVVR